MSHKAVLRDYKKGDKRDDYRQKNLMDRDAERSTIEFILRGGRFQNINGKLFPVAFSGDVKGIGVSPNECNVFGAVHGWSDDIQIKLNGNLFLASDQIFVFI